MRSKAIIGGVAAATLAVAAYAIRHQPTAPPADGTAGRDSSGVTIVDNRQVTFTSACPTIHVRPQTTIGPVVTNATDTTALFRVAGGTVLSDGSIVVLNAGTQELVFLEPDGSLRNLVGGEGSGPGEFRRPEWLASSGDTIFVWDMRLSRWSLFGSGGQFLSSRRISIGRDRPGPSSVRGRFVDGSLLLVSVPIVVVPPGISRSGRTYSRTAVGTGQTAYMLNGTSAETFAGDGGVYSLPFGKTELVLVHRDWLLVGDNGSSMIRYFDADGRLRRIVRWPTVPRPVTDADRERMASTLGGTVDVHALVSAEERPRFAALRSDPSGGIWVREFAADWESPPDWLVFGDDGTLRCRVSAPARFAIMEIGHKQILGIAKDEYDEETVTVYELERS